MGSFSIWHWIIVGAIVLVLFGGKGKISDLMGDFAKGIKSFRAGMREEDEVAAPAPAPTAANPTAPQATVAPPASAAPASEDHKTKV